MHSEYVLAHGLVAIPCLLCKGGATALGLMTHQRDCKIRQGPATRELHEQKAPCCLPLQDKSISTIVMQEQLQGLCVCSVVTLTQ